jgi:hypothetical protein
MGGQRKWLIGSVMEVQGEPTNCTSWSNTRRQNKWRDGTAGAGFATLLVHSKHVTITRSLKIPKSPLPLPSVVAGPPQKLKRFELITVHCTRTVVDFGRRQHQLKAFGIDGLTKQKLSRMFILQPLSFSFFYLFPFWNFIKQFMWGTRIQGKYLASSLWGSYSQYSGIGYLPKCTSYGSPCATYYFLMYRYAPHNDGPHIRRWSHNIVI